MWAVALVIIGVAFATEASSLATFAGLLTAGVAVAMQSVLVSIVGYFFLVGKYGLRVGDHVQIGERHRRSARLRSRAPAFDGARSAARPDRPRRSPRQLGGVPSVGRHLQADPRREPRVARGQPDDTGRRRLRRHQGAVARAPPIACWRSTATSSIGRRASCREHRRRAAPEKAQAHVQLRFSAGSIDALVRYPVPLQRAAEVEERMSRALFDAVRESGGRAGAAHGATHLAQAMSIATRTPPVWSALALLVLGAIPAVALAQWLDYPTPGIPRTASGAPDLKAPAPRTREGKPDFSGIWFANVPAKDYCKEKDCVQEERMAREQINLGIKLPDGLPYTEWSKEQMVTRRANGGREDPHTYCKPPNFPRAWTLPQYIKIVQTPGEMVMLHEFNAAYRDVFLDGRPLPDNPNPTWNGYSTGALGRGHAGHRDQRHS